MFRKASFTFLSQTALQLAVMLLITQPCYGWRILIDPGHGGQDTGAIKGNFLESTVAWDWSLELKRVLLDKNLEVEMTRNETQGLSLHNRVARLNQKKYDLILSLHANYLLDPRVQGIEFYVATPLDLEDQKLHLAHEEIQLKTGQKKAEIPLQSLNEEQNSQVSAIIGDLLRQTNLEKSLNLASQLNLKWPGKIKQGPFDLLDRAESPIVLIELGFLSNPTDLKQLTNPQFRLEKCVALADAVEAYLKKSKSLKQLAE